MVKSIKDEEYYLSHSWLKNKKKWLRKKRLRKKFNKNPHIYFVSKVELPIEQTLNIIKKLSKEGIEQLKRKEDHKFSEFIEETEKEEKNYISPALKRIEQKAEEAKKEIDKRGETNIKSHEDNDYTSRYILHS
jgi:hypothetical protein